MNLVVLSILRVDKHQKEHKVAMYAGLSSNNYIYGKLINSCCEWPTYIKIKRSLTDSSLNEEGKGTLIRKLFVKDSKPMKFSKKFRELTKRNLKDIPFINDVDNVISLVQYIRDNYI